MQFSLIFLHSYLLLTLVILNRVKKIVYNHIIEKEISLSLINLTYIKKNYKIFFYLNKPYLYTIIGQIVNSIHSYIEE